MPILNEYTRAHMTAKIGKQRYIIIREYDEVLEQDLILQPIPNEIFPYAVGDIVTMSLYDTYTNVTFKLARVSDGAYVFKRHVPLTVGV